MQSDQEWCITHVPPGSGRSVWIGEERVTVKAMSADTMGGYASFEVETPPGGGPPPHIHHRADVAYYALAGEYELVDLDHDRTVRLLPGAFALVPRGILHTFRNPGGAAARLLLIVTPSGGIERFVEEAGLDAPAGAGTAAAPAEWRRVSEIARRYNVEMQVAPGTVGAPGRE